MYEFSTLANANILQATSLVHVDLIGAKLKLSFEKGKTNTQSDRGKSLI